MICIIRLKEHQIVSLFCRKPLMFLCSKQRESFLKIIPDRILTEIIQYLLNICSPQDPRAPLSVCPQPASLSACLPDDVNVCSQRSFLSNKQENEFIHGDTGKSAPCRCYVKMCCSGIGLDTIHTNTTGQRGCMNDKVAIMVLLCMSSSPIPPLCNHCNTLGKHKLQHDKRGNE